MLPSALSGLGRAGWRAALESALERAPSPAHALAATERLLESGGRKALSSWPAAGLDDLLAILGASPAMARTLAGMGESWPDCARRYQDPNPGQRGLASLSGARRARNEEQLAERLHELAALEMLRIGARDLLGLATLEDTTQGLTELAEFSIKTTVDRLRRILVHEQGDVLTTDGRPLGFVVLGMGKLGAGELNYSSDVDLVCLYESAPLAEGCPDAGSFFSSLVSGLSRVIGGGDSGGFVFRVDLDLRPEGMQGPVVNPMAAALSYYEGWGDTWERGVMLKARPVGGQLELGEEFVREIQPFVFRRHLDYQTIEDFRRMKERIDAELAELPRETRNVKIGWGGIRELEFVVQLMQIVHGGHVHSVRCRGTLPALVELEKHGFMTSEDTGRLREAYVFLRDVEHALQVVERRQTQTLPSGREELVWLARRLGYGTGRRGRPVLDPAARGDEADAFEADWQRHTGQVREAFIRFLELRTDSSPVASTDSFPALVDDLSSGRLDEAAAGLEELGLRDAGAAASSLQRLFRGRGLGPMNAQRRRAIEAMAPALLDAVVSSGDPDRALGNLVEFLLRTGAHTSYLALLGGSPATMLILVRLFAGSALLSSLLVGHPELIDSLVRSDRGAPTRERGDMEADLARACDAVDEEEDLLTALRRFKSAELLRVGFNDLAGELDDRQVARELVTLAEVCLCEAARLARRLLGLGEDPGRGRVRLAVLAMGRLGAGELGYGSDLDIIFVYQGRGDDFDETAHTAATRLAQKIVSLLRVPTRDGRVFEVDTRLRPSGRGGPLVTSLDRFINYHDKEADLWERQALLRGRVVYGPATLARRIHSELQRLVYTSGLSESGIREIAELRDKVIADRDIDEELRLNFKVGRGGIADLETIVQVLQLAHGHSNELLRAACSTGDTLAVLREEGLLDRADAERLEAAYVFLRRLESGLRLDQDKSVEDVERDARLLGPVACRMGFTGPSASADLLTEVDARRALVSEIYARHLAGDPSSR